MMAVTGALALTNRVINSSWMIGCPAIADDTSIEATNIAPAATVFVIDGPCIREKKSRSRNNPKEPMSVVSPASTSNTVPGIVTQSGSVAVVMVR
jgi:hypothetical protein